MIIIIIIIIINLSELCINNGLKSKTPLSAVKSKFALHLLQFSIMIKIAKPEMVIVIIPRILLDSSMLIAANVALIRDVGKLPYLQ